MSGHFRHFSQLFPKENVPNEFSVLLVLFCFVFLLFFWWGGWGEGGTCYSGMCRSSKIHHCSHKTQASRASRDTYNRTKNHKTLFIGDMFSLIFSSNMAETSSTTSIINTPLDQLDLRPIRFWISEIRNQDNP